MLSQAVSQWRSEHPPHIPQPLHLSTRRSTPRCHLHHLWECFYQAVPSQIQPSRPSIIWPRTGLTCHSFSSLFSFSFAAAVGSWWFCHMYSQWNAATLPCYQPMWFVSAAYPGVASIFLFWSKGLGPLKTPQVPGEELLPVLEWLSAHQTPIRRVPSSVGDLTLLALMALHESSDFYPFLLPLSPQIPSSSAGKIPLNLSQIWSSHSQS